ncbi:hypothetical protein LPJ61_006174, partial [Coemansia biformis]
MASSPHNPALSFSKPPESLSLRTQVSITSKSPLRGLNALEDDGSLLSLTSLCNHGRRNPLCPIADALVFWELAGKKATTAILNQPNPSAQSKSNGGSAGLSDVPTGVPEAQVKQAFASLFRLQAEAPLRYPFVYLSVRDHIIVFKAIPVSASKKKAGGDVDGSFKRVAVVSESYLGLRKVLHNANVEFSLPLAPQINSWSEIPGISVADKGADKCHLQSTAVDRTWRSAILLIGANNVEGLVNHLQSISMEGAVLYATGPFLNATMRRSSVRLADAVAYNDTDGARQTVHLYKVDITGVLFPSAWNAILRALPEIAEGEFSASFKEVKETAHLNMLVSKQGSAVTGKKCVTYDP